MSDQRIDDPASLAIKRDLGEREESESESVDSISCASLDAIASELADESPAPNVAAIEAEKEKSEAFKREFAHLRDRDGNPFDPAIHATNADGTPKLTANGKLRKRPGRKSGDSVGVSSKSRLGGIPGASAPVTSAEGITHEQRAQARAAGVSAANALITLGVALGGDEWQPIVNHEQGIDERAQLENAFGAYFEAKGLRDIPPGVALTIAVGAYALPRFTRPKTQKRVSTLKEKLFVWIAKRRARKHESQSDTRNDGKRQNDVSEGTRAASAA